jgi:glycosyltransferase involved in cell wall biosynthesis
LAGRTTVAVDVGSLIGRPTGVGRFTAELVHALDALADPPVLVRYVLSGRAALPTGVVRLPYPARAALAAWGRVDHPRGRRSLRGVDVVHGTNYVVPPTGWPTVVTVHDCSPLTHPERVHPVVRAFVPVLRRAVAAGAWVHTPSAYVAAQAGELLGTTRVRAIPHGAPRPLATDATSRQLTPALAVLAGRPYVLAVGTIEPRKNLPRLVAAFGAVADDHPDVALVLAGADGPDSPAVTAAIERLAPPVRRRVVTTGWIDDATRERLLWGASVFAYPSLDEGFGLPLLEAFAASVPVVAAAAGALPEVAGDAALLVTPTDVDALANALAVVLDDDATRRRLLAAGHRRLAHFDWSATAAAMVGLYRDAIG